MEEKKARLVYFFQVLTLFPLFLVVMSRTRQVFLHVHIWLAIMLFFVLTGSRNNSVRESIIIFVYFGLFNIALFYINYLYILPRFLNSRKYLSCAISIVVLILAAAVMKYGLANVFRDTILVNSKDQTVISFWDYFLASVLTSTFFVFLSTALKFSSDWFLNERVKKNLEKDKLAAELAFLKSQVNPHFLFNSLNNIYSLAYQKSDKTPEAILKLSEIMRYMLQESNETKVDLAQELRYLNNYIELQKLRFKRETYIEMLVESDGSRQEIAPLILIAFVENAFKHGTVSDPESPIRISITIRQGKLLFSVFNKRSRQNKDETSGIGLNNVKRRLELLYQGKYILNITENEQTYYSELSLVLSDDTLPCS